jgi:hypothetical protein
MTTLRVSRDGKRLTDLIFDQGRLISGVKGKDIPAWVVLAIMTCLVKQDALAGFVEFRGHRYGFGEEAS